jgi:hypothetical protein
MMQHNSADLLSKLRQRLFLANMWSANKMPGMMDNGGDVKMPTVNQEEEEAIENNNEPKIDVTEGDYRDGEILGK